MKDRFKKLTVELYKKFQLVSYEFLIKNLKEEEDTTDIINLVLSAHMSALFNCMSFIASDHEEHTKKVKKFIHDLSTYLSKLKPISNIEIIDE